MRIECLAPVILLTRLSRWSTEVTGTLKKVWTVFTNTHTHTHVKIYFDLKNKWFVFRVKQWGQPLRDKPNQVHMWHHHKCVTIKCTACVISSVFVVFRSAEDGGVCGLLWSSSPSGGVRSAAAALRGWCHRADPGRGRFTVVGGGSKNSLCQNTSSTIPWI